MVEGRNPAHEYDVALSFAGEDRAWAERLAHILKANDVRVFYDAFEEGALWGRSLYEHLHDVYSARASYCVIFLSKHYARKAWTNHERQAAQARALEERERAYILPIRLDDTPIPGMSESVAYVHIDRGIEHIANLVLAKLELRASGEPTHVTPPGRPWRIWTKVGLAISAVVAVGLVARWLVPTPPALDSRRPKTPAVHTLEPPPPGMARIAGARFTVGIADATRFREWCIGHGGTLKDCDAAIHRAKAREVVVDTFDMDRAEVTAGELQEWLEARIRGGEAQMVRDAVVRTGDRTVLVLPACHGLGQMSPKRATVELAGEARRAAICVSHAAAEMYCRDVHKRLPTASEWELAAGGAAKRSLPWQNHDDLSADCTGAVFGRMEPYVCAHLPPGPESVDGATIDVTPEGLRFMGGNVSEWVEPDASAPASRDPFLIRGGSWAGPPIDLHPTKLTPLSADEATLVMVGFRCARTPSRSGGSP